MKILTAIVVLLIAPSLAFSATIYVPDNYAKIQGAIYAAANGDSVIVRPGTYVENINFMGKTITVRSERGPEVTTIDGGNPKYPDYARLQTVKGPILGLVVSVAGLW